jgi:hypothetical protein
MQIILPHNTEIFEEQLNHAAEELSIGDSDDPPLSEELASQAGICRIAVNTPIPR